MKLPRLLPTLFLITVCGAFAAADSPPIELRGILTVGDAPRFALATPGGTQAWVVVGDTFAGWTLSEYLVAEDKLILTKEGRTASIRLSSSAVGVSAATNTAGPGTSATAGTRATLADAEAVLDKIKFDQMIERMLKTQKESMAAMAKQLAAQAGGEGATEGQQALQAKLTETVFAELNTEAMRADLARAYSEVYSKEELQAIANFYGSAAGQAMADKAPEVAARTQAAMLPRLMAATNKAQQLAKDLATKPAAKTPATPDATK